jgi:hypothetical protein
LPEGDHVAPLRGIGPMIIGEVCLPSFDSFADFDHAAHSGIAPSATRPESDPPKDPHHGS